MNNISQESDAIQRFSVKQLRLLAKNAVPVFQNQGDFRANLPDEDENRSDETARLQKLPLRELRKLSAKQISHSNPKRMFDLLGIPVGDLGFELVKKGDLWQNEGALVSHFVDAKDPNQHYLYKWCDGDETGHRWAIFKVSMEHLYDFLSGQRTLLQLVRENPYLFFVDLDSDWNRQAVSICPTPKIPTEYLPAEDSFLKLKASQKYAMELLAKQAGHSKQFDT
jgi:hypothetical protein